MGRLRLSSCSGLPSVRRRCQPTAPAAPAADALEDTIHRLARQKATPISLRDLYKYGMSSSPAQQLRNAQFLHRELPIRMAQRVAELQQLPYGLSEQRDVRDVLGWYRHYTGVMAFAPRPEREEDTAAFTGTCEYVLQDHQSVVEALSMGALQLRRKKSRQEWSLIKSEVSDGRSRQWQPLLEPHLTGWARALRWMLSSTAFTWPASACGFSWSTT